MLSKVGSLLSPTNTGNVSVTGIGFEPKAVLLWTVGTSADGNTTDHRISWGVGTSSISRWTSGSAGNDGGNDAARVFKSDKILSIVNHVPTVQIEADLYSLDFDGFTLNWTTIQGTQLQIFYIAIGGDDVSAKAGTYNTASSTGNQNVTGVGFQPDVILFGQSLDDTTEPGASYFWWDVSMAKSSTSRALLALSGSDDTSVIESKSSLITSKILRNIYAGTTYTEADLVSRNVDGFTINNTSITQKPKVGFLALSGVTSKIGTFSENTSTGNQAITGVGFQPELLFFISRSKASGTTSTASATAAIGAATSSTERWAISSSRTEANPYLSDRRAQSSKVLTHLTAGTPTLAAEADLVTMDTDGFTINMSTVDGTSREVAYLALGTPEPPPPSTGTLTVNATNPRYFDDGSGNAIVLVGSHNWWTFQNYDDSPTPAEFNFSGYLDFLEGLGHNFTRGWYWESPKFYYNNSPYFPGFLVGDNYVDPMPWERTGPGNANDGGLKFDLNSFNQDFFDRLRQRIIDSGERGIYYSVMLFQGFSLQDDSRPPIYDAWQNHPFNSANNINSVNGDPGGDNQGYETHLLTAPTALPYQEAYVQKIIDELNDLDNVFWEIANESVNTSDSWQEYMVDFIHTYEATKPKQHLVCYSVPLGTIGTSLAPSILDSNAEVVSLGVAEGYKDDPPENDGDHIIINDTDHNWGIGGNRNWAWKSFTHGLHPIYMDGWTYGETDAEVVSLRANLGYIREYSERMNLEQMTPQAALSNTGYILAKNTNPGEYLSYRTNAGDHIINLSAVTGSFTVEWFNPATNTVTMGSNTTGGASRTLTPPFSGDSVLYLKAVATGFSVSVSDNITVTENKSAVIPLVIRGAGPLAATKFRGIDRMKYTKDLVRNQPGDQFIEETVDFIAQKYNIGHQAIAIPMDLDADYTSEGVAAPSTRTVYNFIQKWFTEIHEAGDKVLFRGTYNWVEKENDHALYDFKLRVGANRYDLGIVASAPTDGQTTIYGRLHAFIVNTASFWEHGDMFAPFPERGENNTHQRTITLTRSGSTVTATTTSGNHDIGNGQPVTISGAVQTEYNGDFVITKTADNTFTYTIAGTPTTPATGTITVTFGTSPYTQGQSFFPHTGGAQAGYASFFNDLVDVSRNAFRLIKKNVYVGMTAHSWSEVDSNWYPQSIFDKVGLTVFDHYGVAHTVAEMEGDWDDTYTGKGYPMFHQEWSDYWYGTTIVDSTRAAFLREFYAAAGVRVANGKLIGFNDWSGWDGGTGEQILVNNGDSTNPDFALRDRGLILQEAFNGTADTINVYEFNDVALIIRINKSESITVSESTASKIPTLFINKSESITVTENFSLLRFVPGGFNINVFESIIVTDIAHRYVDQVFVTESVKVTLVRNISVSEGIIVVDTRTNYILNPSFEVDTTNWYGQDDNTTALGAQYSRSTTQANLGSASLRFTSGSPTNMAARSRSIVVLPGKTYTASAYIYLEAGYVGNASIDIYERNAGNGAVLDGANTANPESTGVWTRVSITQTMQPTAGLVYIRLVNDGNAVGTAYFDNIQFELAGTVSEYIDGNQALSQWDGTANASSSSTSVLNTKLIEESNILETENINVSESYTVIGPPANTLSISKSESISITENKNVALASNVNETESITLTESIGKILTAFVIESESITVTDTPLIAKSESTLFVSKTESISITENKSASINNATALSVSVNDSVTLTENVQRIQAYNINKSESITLTENKALYEGLSINKTETISLTENINRGTQLYISKSESITLTENKTVLRSGGTIFGGMDSSDVGTWQQGVKLISFG